MQEQKQVERQYSFEDTCPEWSQILAENGGYKECVNDNFVSEEGRQRSIQNGACCIVGEAHSAH